MHQIMCSYLVDTVLTSIYVFIAKIFGIAYSPCLSKFSWKCSSSIYFYLLFYVTQVTSCRH